MKGQGPVQDEDDRENMLCKQMLIQSLSLQLMRIQLNNHTKLKEKKTSSMSPCQSTSHCNHLKVSVIQIICVVLIIISCILCRNSHWYKDQKGSQLCRVVYLVLILVPYESLTAASNM